MPGEWHNRMEGYFPEDMREVKFFCSSRSRDNICRRADVLLNDKRTCEIQHSYISSYEIQERFKHWNTFGKDIIWLVDGNTDDVTLEKLTKGTYLIEFVDCWKYKSFRGTYDYILLDIKDNIYKIPLKEVKCKMVEVKEYKHIDDVIKLLKTNPENIWDMWEDENNVNSSLTIHQKGAGNGKTYGIWESICKNNDKETYIIVTKQHTAKEVIYQELKDQSERREEHVIENISDKLEENTEKHYVIKYIHTKSGKKCIVIIATIDSFCYNLTKSDNTTDDFFKGLLTSITLKGCNKLHEGFMKYASQYIRLNKKSELWIDEVQDLSIEYLNAMTRIMLETSIDINVVGDELQSLEYEHNFLTALSDGLPNINIINSPPENNNRRIKVKGMYEEINKLIDFGELPEISIDRYLVDNGKPIELIDSPVIYVGDTDIEKINNYINKIIDKVDKEVELHNYKPEDFLFIFPIMKSPSLAEELHGRLQSYWIEKYKEEQYQQYAILHKHQEGQVINTKDSEKTTRIMSIRSSKGDGREVVFILGCTESSLKIVSKGEINLLYESHLHVSLTRAKSKIYFGLHKNNDDIHRRFRNLGNVGYLPIVKCKLKPNDLLMNINKQKIIDILKLNVDSLEDSVFSQLGETVDWKYHCIKMQLYNQYFIFSLLNNKKIHTDFEGSQIRTIIRGIQRLQLRGIHIKDFYPFLRGIEGELPYFPVCHMKHSTKYDKSYYNIIKITMNKICNTRINKLDTLSPYESVILSYMINLYQSKQYSEMGPKDIYDITDFFETEYTTKEQQLLEHTEVIKNLTNNVIQEIHNTYNEKITWNIHHNIAYNGKNNEFTIQDRYPLVGNSDNYAFHFVLKSDYNSLNYWDTLIEILIERFIITTPKGNDRDINNITRYNNKSIITYLLILNTNSYEVFNWTWENTTSDKLKEDIIEAIISYYRPFHKEYYNYLHYVVTNNIYEGSPYEYIKNQIHDTHPLYIVEYFKELDDNYDDGDEIDIEDTFMKKLDKKLKKRCNTYMK